LAYNGSGTFVRVHNFATDKTNLVPVTASRMDAEIDGIATGLSTAITKDGQTSTTARIPFAAGASAFAGSVSGVSYGQTNDANTGLYFPAADQWGLVAGGTATITSTATAVTVPATMTVTGAGSFSSTLAATGNFAVNTDKFTVAAASGNTAVAGTLAVTGATTLSAALTVSTGGAAVTGNSTITGTFGVSSDFAVATNKFTVTAASGNTLIAGTASVTGDVAVNTNKFTVTAASGNTAIAGTLAVTGASTLTGAVTANNSAGITGRNTVKAFGKVINGTLQSGGFNVASVTDVGIDHDVAFSSAMANTNYVVLITLDGTNANVSITLSYTDVLTTGFTVNGYIAAVGAVDPDSYSFMVLSNE